MLKDRQDEMERLDDAHRKALERIQAEAFDSKLKESSDTLDEVGPEPLARPLLLRCPRPQAAICGPFPP